MYKFIITTTDSLEVTDKISDYLLTSNLSPCVQVLSNVDSRYLWKGEIRSHKEHFILIKSKSGNCKKISTYIKSVHNYEVAEIAEVDFNILNGKYKKWFNKSSI